MRLRRRAWRGWEDVGGEHSWLLLYSDYVSCWTPLYPRSATLISSTLFPHLRESWSREQAKIVYERVTLNERKRLAPTLLK